MRIIIAVCAIITEVCVVTGRAWRADSHGKQIGAVLVVAAIFVALEVVVSFARRGRTTSRPAPRPYVAPAKKR